MEITSKKTIIAFVIALLAIFSVNSQALAVEEAAEETIVIHFFDDRLCPVCRDAKNFIESILEDYPQVELKIYPISEVEKLHQVAKDHGIEDYRTMAPTIFIGDNFFQFRDFTSRQKEVIIKALEGEIVEAKDCCLVRIPIINLEINIRDLPLPVKTFILGSLDGFNVCSIGALILIISIVIILNSRRKMFFYGGLYIITASFIYGALVFLWGGVVDALIGQLEILRIIVGLAALAGAIYFSKEFWRFFKYGPACQMSESALVKRATNKLKESFENPGKGALILVSSIVSFAAVITIVELPCSIGLPIAFTAILLEEGISLTNTPLPYTLYIAAYIFFYMLIEIIIFSGAVLTKKIWFAGSKLITWVTFAGAAVLFYLAFYYLFS